MSLDELGGAITGALHSLLSSVTQPVEARLDDLEQRVGRLEHQNEPSQMAAARPVSAIAATDLPPSEPDYAPPADPVATAPLVPVEPAPVDRMGDPHPNQ